MPDGSYPFLSVPHTSTTSSVKFAPPATQVVDGRTASTSVERFKRRQQSILAAWNIRFAYDPHLNRSNAVPIFPSAGSEAICGKLGIHVRKWQDGSTINRIWLLSQRRRE
ncbi:MAG: hypothetical protein ACJATT_005397 [Myxococcota bacterium]